MVKVTGTHGPVQVEILGINDTRLFLKQQKIVISNAAEKGLVQAATFVGKEVQESIIGNRSEKRSVDTGAFGNSITIKAEGKNSIIIYPENIPYAEYLEFGTSKLPARRHFENTKNRTKEIMYRMLENEIVKSIKFVGSLPLSKQLTYSKI